MEAIDFIRSFLGIFSFQVKEKTLPYSEEWSDGKIKAKSQKQKTVSKVINLKIMKK